MSNEEYYKKSDEDNEDEFAGFSIVDAKGLDVERIQKLIKKAVESDDEPTIASKIPENEMTVILDNAAMLLPLEGTPLTLKFDFEDDCIKAGSVYDNDKKIGDFKPAFLSRLFTTKKGQYCTCKMHLPTPLMVKLIFSTTKTKNCIKI